LLAGIEIRSLVIFGTTFFLTVLCVFLLRQIRLEYFIS